MNIHRLVCLPLLLSLSGVVPALAADLAPFSPTTVPADVRLAYDKLNDVTLVQLKPQYVHKDKGRLSDLLSVKIFAFFHCHGDTVAAPDSVTIVVAHEAQVRLGVAAESADWWFSAEDPHTLRVLIDDVRHELGNMTYRRGTQAATLISERGLSWRPGMRATPELLLLTVSADTAVRLFGAEVSEGQVDGLRFYLHHKEGGVDKNYREFAAFIRDLGVLRP